MTRAVVLAGALVLAATPAAQAQGRFYAGTSMAVDAGRRGDIPGGAVPSAGALLGIRLTERWSVEVEVDRGFRTTTAGSGESVLVSFPPTPHPTRDEIERYGIRTLDLRTQKAGAGWSALTMWRSAASGRLSAGLLGGVSSRAYTTTLDRSTTFVSPLANLPPNYRLPDERSSRTMNGTGITGGVIVFVRVTERLSVAPEFRLTTGLITDDPYTVFRTGVRAVWAF